MHTMCFPITIKTLYCKGILRRAYWEGKEWYMCHLHNGHRPKWTENNTKIDSTKFIIEGKRLCLPSYVIVSSLLGMRLMCILIELYWFVLSWRDFLLMLASWLWFICKRWLLKVQWVFCFLFWSLIYFRWSFHIIKIDIAWEIRRTSFIHSNIKDQRMFLGRGKLMLMIWNLVLSLRTTLPLDRVPFPPLLGHIRVDIPL